MRNRTPTVFTRIPLEPLLLDTKQVDEEPSIFDSISETAKTAWLYMRLLPYFIKIIGGLVMKDWKTTLTAVVGGLAALINYYTGFVVPQGAIEFITMIAGFYFAADGKKVGND